MFKRLSAAAVGLEPLHIFQETVVKALDTDGEAGNTRGAERVKNFRAQVSGIRFDRDIAHRKKITNESDRLDQLFVFSGWSPAAEVRGGEVKAGLMVAVKLFAQRVKVTLRDRMLMLDAMKGAKGTEGLAKRNMKIKSPSAASRNRRRKAREIFHSQKAARA